MSADYKKSIITRYIPITPDDIGTRIVDADEFFFSEKLDGIFASMTKEGKEIVFRSSGDEVIPFHLTTSLKLPNKTALYGEIYLNGKGRHYHFDVSKALAEDPSQLTFHVFDAATEKGWNSLEEKIAWLEKHVPTKSDIRLIPQEKISLKKDILKAYQNLPGDAEGAVLRCSNGAVYKIKNRINLDLVVLGYSMGYSHKQDLLRDLLVGIQTDKDTFQILGAIGNGLSEKERKDWLKKLKITATSNHIEVSGNKTAYQFVPPKYVIEIDCLDIITESTQGRIAKPILVYNSSKKFYDLQEFSNGVSLIGGVFLRERSDKKVSQEDTGLSQIGRYVAMDSPSPAESGKQKDTEVLQREVYTKVTKGKTSVRKFLLCKSNKEITHPPYFVLYTDWSPDRKEPLQQDITPSLNEKLSKDIFQKYIEENIKKGWNKEV